MNNLRLHRFASVPLLVLGLAALAAGAERITSAQGIALATSKAPFFAPPIAKQMKLTGVVEIDVTVAEDGEVEKTEVVRGNPILAKAAADTLKKWKFKPAKKDDQAIKVIFTVGCDFK